MEKREENLRGRSGADSKQSGGKFAKFGLRWGKGAELALSCRFCTHILRQVAPWDRTWRPTLSPSLRQEEVKRAKLGPRWRQVRAKSGQRERRGGLRSDLGTKSWILKLVVFHRKNVYFLDIGSAKWRQVGIEIGKIRLRFRKLRRGWGREGKIEARGRKKRQG